MNTNDKDDNEADRLQRLQLRIEDGRAAFEELARVARQTALVFRLIADPVFMARPSPIEFSAN